MSPYGRTYVETWDAGTWVRASRPESAFGNPFMWTAQRYDPAAGLYHFTYRSYSPTLGRWLQRDPLGYVDGVNVYEYVRSAPLSFVDALGFARVVIYDNAFVSKTGKGWWSRARSRRSFYMSAHGLNADHVIGVASPQEAASKLERLVGSGVEIEHLDIIGHGYPGMQYLGPDWINPYEDPQTWKRIGETIAPGGIVALHGCKVADTGPTTLGDGPTYLQLLADIAQRTVTGQTGRNYYTIVTGEVFQGEKIIKEPTQQDPPEQGLERDNSWVLTYMLLGGNPFGPPLVPIAPPIPPDPQNDNETKGDQSECED